MLRDDPRGQGIRLGVVPDLGEQRLLEVLRAHAHRIEGLDHLHHLVEPLVPAFGHQGFRGLDVEAVGVQIVDEKLADLEGLLVDRLKMELPQQVILERLRAGEGPLDELALEVAGLLRPVPGVAGIRGLLEHAVLFGVPLLHLVQGYRGVVLQDLEGGILLQLLLNRQPEIGHGHGHQLDGLEELGSQP